ncbi:unnamed protein product [Closterium sp. NIES-64]|nr:unnamed protein product [Closterium sp. NIES-64]
MDAHNFHCLELGRVLHSLNRIHYLPIPPLLLLLAALLSSKAAAQVCQEYPLQAVMKATNGWSEANLLGTGGFGESDGHKRPPQPREAAVSIGITDKTRVEQILIYELMPNGDLSHWIGKVSPLSFERRVQQQLAQSGSRAVVAWLKQTRMEARDDLVLTVVQLALRCTSKQSAPRPAMGVIAAELEAVLVALGGAHRNAGARQVDEEVELQRPDVDLDAEIARHSLL